MKPKNILLLVFTVATLSSCYFSYSKGTDVKMKKKTIEGVEYIFTNQSKMVKKRMGLIGNSQLENIIDFSGMDKPIHKTISSADFNKKVNTGNTEFFVVDSISFTVSNNRDRIDLCYYLNLDNKKKRAVFTLENHNGKWNLN